MTTAFAVNDGRRSVNRAQEVTCHSHRSSLTPLPMLLHPPQYQYYKRPYSRNRVLHPPIWPQRQHPTSAVRFPPQVAPPAPTATSAAKHHHNLTTTTSLLLRGTSIARSTTAPSSATPLPTSFLPTPAALIPTTVPAAASSPSSTSIGTPDPGTTSPLDSPGAVAAYVRRQPALMRLLLAGEWGEQGEGREGDGGGGGDGGSNSRGSGRSSTAGRGGSAKGAASGSTSSTSSSCCDCSGKGSFESSSSSSSSAMGQSNAYYSNPNSPSGPNQDHLEVTELSGGRINYVWRVSGPYGDVVLKYAAPYVRSIGPDFRLSQTRLSVEARALAAAHAACPRAVPALLLHDPAASVLVQQMVGGREGGCGSEGGPPPRHLGTGRKTAASGEAYDDQLLAGRGTRDLDGADDVEGKAEERLDPAVKEEVWQKPYQGMTSYNSYSGRQPVVKLVEALTRRPMTTGPTMTTTITTATHLINGATSSTRSRNQDDHSVASSSDDGGNAVVPPPYLAADMVALLAGYLLRYSKYDMSDEQYEDVLSQMSNDEVVAANAAVVFTDPWDVGCARNRVPVGLESEVETLRKDPRVRAEVCRLHLRYLTHRETLIHNDLTTGNILVPPPPPLGPSGARHQQAATTSTTVTTATAISTSHEKNSSKAAAANLHSSTSKLMLASSEQQQVEPGSTTSAFSASSSSNYKLSGFTHLIDWEFATYGSMAYDIGSLLGNLLLSYCASIQWDQPSQLGYGSDELLPAGRGEPSVGREVGFGEAAVGLGEVGVLKGRLQLPLLDCVAELWGGLEARLLRWVADDRMGVAAGQDGAAAEGAAAQHSSVAGRSPRSGQALDEDFVEEVLSDSLGYAGCVMARLLFGMHTYPALATLAPYSARTASGRLALRLAGALLDPQQRTARGWVGVTEGGVEGGGIGALVRDVELWTTEAGGSG